MATPREEALMLAPKFSEQVGDGWVFRWKSFDLAASSKRELVDVLTEAIRQLRERDGYVPAPEPPPPTHEEVHALALTYGMQSPEFMEAAEARMMADLRERRRKRRQSVEIKSPDITE